jgi:hypothetical protein
MDFLVNLLNFFCAGELPRRVAAVNEHMKNSGMDSGKMTLLAVVGAVILIFIVIMVIQSKSKKK